MKNLITILLLIISITSYGQSELEVKIFKYFNEYRIENGLKPLKFDKKVLLAAQHHNTYLNKHIQIMGTHITIFWIIHTTKKN